MTVQIALCLVCIGLGLGQILIGQKLQLFVSYKNMEQGGTGESPLDIPFMEKT